MAPVAPHLIKALRRRTRIARQRPPVVPGEKELALYEQAQAGAVQRNLRFELTPSEFALLLTRADGRCEETGLPFEDRKVPGYRYRPYWMSLDRLSNDSGYSLENLRVVHAVVNLLRGRTTFQQMKIQKILSLARDGALVQDDMILSRGIRPEDWKF